MKKLGLFAVLLGVALFVGCAQQAETPATGPAPEGEPAAGAPAGDEAKEAAPAGEKPAEKAEGEKPAENEQ